MAGVVVWTSWLQRTIQTAQHIHGLQERLAIQLYIIHTHDPCLIERSYFRWKTLNEIDAGDLDGLSYEEIKDQYPEEYSCRHGDKFMYR